MLSARTGSRQARPDHARRRGAYAAAVAAFAAAVAVFASLDAPFAAAVAAVTLSPPSLAGASTSRRDSTRTTHREPERRSLEGVVVAPFATATMRDCAEDNRSRLIEQRTSAGCALMCRVSRSL